MRILVYPHDLGIGGSQLNAIQLAAAARERGHDVAVYGQPGPLVAEVAGAGLEFIESPAPSVRPTPRIVRHLAGLVKSRRIDVVHAYEWPPSLEAVLACRLAGTGRAVSTVLSMSVAPFIPRDVPLAVGTAQILEAERRFGRRSVCLLEPPVDVVLNAPGAVHTAAFERAHGMTAEAFTVSIVSRLAREMKLEGILAAMDSAAILSHEAPFQLLVVGGGPAEAQVRARAERVNDGVGQRIVICTGELRDPRPAYAVADVGLGMGSSALRSMAFGVPLVVQGERGFWCTLTPSTLENFLWEGWYGIGQGAAGSAERLAGLLRELRDDAALRRRLGLFARRTAAGRFSVNAVAARTLSFYSKALGPGAPRPRMGEALGAAVRFARYSGRRFVESRMGGAPTDDFNSRPVVATGSAAPGVGR